MNYVALALSVTAAPAAAGCDLGVGNQVLLFGGSTAPDQGLRADTWAWNGDDWRPLGSADAPSARDDHAMAYDAGRGRVVLFGGCTRGDCAELTPAADTWEWHEGRWEIAEEAGPTHLYAHEMIYDARRGRTVLFGGYFGGGSGEGEDGGPGVSSQLWEWDGARWENRTVAPGPTGGSATLAYDSHRGRMVLFDRGADIWEWDGSLWYQPSPSVSPSFRFHAAMAYDEARGRTVLFGGYHTVTNSFGETMTEYFDDTWEWDGETWEQRDPTDRPQVVASEMAYAPDLGRVVLFGASEIGGDWGEVWIWDGTNWEERPPSSGPPHRSDTAVTGL